MYPKGIDVEEYNITCYLFRPFILDENFTLSLILESTEPETEIKLVMDTEDEDLYLPTSLSLHNIFANKHLYLPHDTLTIRCDLKIPFESLVESFVSDESRYFKNFMKQSCTTRTKMHRRSEFWPIQNIKTFLEQQITAHHLITNPIPNSPTLDLSLIFDKISSDGYVQMEIKQNGRSYLFVNCKMTVISGHHNFQISQESSHRFGSKNDKVWKFPAFIKASNLTEGKYLFQDDTLLLHCDFAFIHDKTLYHSNYKPFPFPARPDDKNKGVCTAIENFYQNEKFCDVKLQTHGKTFSFYKVILCLRSPVFSAMFEKDMKEKNSNVVEISDVDPDTLNRLLTYMCTSTIKGDLSHEDACKLYIAADKYEIVPLKTWCLGLLASSLCMASVCDVLVLADAHQDSVLMFAVENFIRHHKEVFHSTHWKVVMEENPKLAMETMLKYL